MTLTEVLPAIWRKRCYIAYAWLGAVTTVVQAGVVAYGHGQPDLLTAWLAMYGVIGTLFGATASANVSASSKGSVVP